MPGGARPSLPTLSPTHLHPRATLSHPVPATQERKRLLRFINKANLGWAIPVGLEGASTGMLWKRWREPE